MRKINILVTSLGGDIGANIVNILNEHKNYTFNIFATDLKEEVFNIDKVTRFYQVEMTKSPKYLDQILKIIQENSIEIIIPVSEKEILWFDQNSTIFENLNVQILINNQNIIQIFLNKLKTSEVLQSILVNTPETYLLNSFNNQIDFPLILKSNYSIKSKQIYIVQNQSELNYLKMSIPNHQDYVIQEYIGSIDEEYTTTVYKSKTKLEVISFKRKLTGGMTSSAIITNEKNLTEYAEKIAHTFNLTGSLNFQSRRVDKKFYIFEVNPRISSTVYIRNHFGFCDVLWWIQDTINYQILNQPTSISAKGKAILGYQYKFFSGE